MKSRILFILSMLFAVMVLSRTAAMSADAKINSLDQSITTEGDALSEPPSAGAADTPPSPLGNTSGRESDQATQGDGGLLDDQCLTPAIATIVKADREKNSKRLVEIKDREVALLALEKTLKIQLAGVEDASNGLDAKIKDMKTIANEDISHLVEMYETMKPKQASEIFNSMDPAFAAGFLRQMKSETAGLIMSGMDPRKSYAISLIIAGKNAAYRRTP